MGTTVIGGMLAASVLAIFLIPVTFYVVEKLSGAKAHTAKPAEPIAHELAPQLGDGTTDADFARLHIVRKTLRHGS